MKTKRRSVALFGLLFFACDNAQESVQIPTQEIELLNALAEESTAAFESSFDNLDKVFAALSVEELEDLDVKDLSKKSVLDYSRSSDILSPHYGVIESIVNSDNSSYPSRKINGSIFSEEGQGHLNELVNAFSLLPDRESFDKEVKRIELEIISTISDKKS